MALARTTDRGTEFPLVSCLLRALASRLQELKQAKDQGLITEAEFQQGKSDLVSGIAGASKTV